LNFAILKYFISQNGDKSLIVGMTDGLLSIRDKKTGIKPTSSSTRSTYNPYNYVSPALVNNSSVNFS
jgi:hypothetical protein